MLNSPVNGKIQGLSRPLSVFQVLFKANVFSRTFRDSPIYSSTFQACANPECDLKVLLVSEYLQNLTFVFLYYLLNLVGKSDKNA